MILLLRKVILKSWRILAFCVFMVWEIIRSSLQVAHAVVSVTSRIKPGVILFPLDAATDSEIFILANTITLTPGTITIDVSDDRKFLYIHALFIDDAVAFRSVIKRGFERRILEFLR
jgi:multicomponent Na+:H+ antiporter subunit E